MALKRLLIVVCAVMLLSGCATKAEYKVNSEVSYVACEPGRWTVTLENGATYSIEKRRYCDIKPGTSVTVYHTANLHVNRILVDGTEEVVE